MKRCVFTVGGPRNGPYLGNDFPCGAVASFEYYDALYKKWRPVCETHLKVVRRRGEASIRKITTMKVKT